MNIKKAREILLRDPEFRKEYYKKDLAFEIAKILVEARIIKRVTQAQLAKMVGTQQPSIARIERGESLPTLSFLQKIAEAFNTYLVPPIFGFMVKIHRVRSYSLNVTQSTFKNSLEVLDNPHRIQYDSSTASSCA